MNTGNWDILNPGVPSVASDLNRTHKPVSKLTDMQELFLRHASKQSKINNVPGLLSKVSEGAV